MFALWKTRQSVVRLLAVACMALFSMLANADGNVVMLGDSNTWLGGDSCDRPQGWTKWFVDEYTPATCRSYARSGATWTNTVRTIRDVDEYTEKLGDNNVIFNQICRLAVAVSEGTQPVPDLIIISAGTNDVWFQSSRPGALDMTADIAFTSDISGRSPSDVLTLAEVVRYCCDILQKSYPEARIVLLTPLQTTAVGLDDICRAGDIIEDCARHLGLMFIRQDKDCCVMRAQELRRKQMTTDGTHTSEEGARRNGKLIAVRLKAR